MEKIEIEELQINRWLALWSRSGDYSLESALNCAIQVGVHDTIAEQVISRWMGLSRTKKLIAKMVEITAKEAERPLGYYTGKLDDDIDNPDTPVNERRESIKLVTQLKFPEIYQKQNAPNVTAIDFGSMFRQIRQEIHGTPAQIAQCN